MHHFFLMMFQSGAVEALKETGNAHIFGNILNTATAITLAVAVRELKTVKSDVEGLKKRELERLERNQQRAYAAANGR